MKHTKSILFAAIAALAVGSASAQTNVVPRNQFNVAGSTALGPVSMPELNAYAVGQGYALQASDTATIASIKSALYSKLVSTATNAKTGIVTQTKDFINVRLIGSEGGTACTGSKLTQNFYALSSTGTQTSGLTNPMTATISFSDVDQASGSFSGLKGARAKAAKLTKAGDLAAINFIWVSSTNFPGSNITGQQVRALLTAGHLPLSYFTGVAGDSTNGVVAVGRDIDSGTRIAYLSESGLGALAPLKQYVFNTNGSGTVSIAPGGTLNGVTYGEGDGGDSSGGTLSTKIAASAALTAANLVGPTNYSGKIYLVACAGAQDATGKALKVLSYNGVTPYLPGTTLLQGGQTNQNVIAEGTYSMWTVGRLYYNAANAPKGTDKTLIPTIASALAANIATNSTASFNRGFTAIGDLKVKRSIEGAVITVK